MNYLDLGLRWIHILAAIALVGGTFFLHFVWLPSTAGMDDQQREASFATIRKPWSRIVMLTTLLLLVSGLVNAVRQIVAHDFGSAPYHVLVLAKLILAFILFFFAARVSGRSAGAVRIRQNISKWLMLNTVVALLLVGIAGYMRMIDRTPKIKNMDQTASTETIGWMAPRIVAPSVFR